MPEIDAGRFPAKRATGETVTVAADIFGDGHDVLAAVLRYRRLARLGQSLRTAKPATLDGQVTEARELMRRYPERSASTVYERELEVVVEPVRARFSTWYELFPRSVGKLKDVERLLPDIAGMGFDVLYLPPIHPIGKTHRKGANNRAAEPGEPGSPWAIGSEEGGH